MNRELAIQLCGLAVMIASGWLLYKALWGKMPHDPPLGLVLQGTLAGIVLFGTVLTSWFYQLLQDHHDRLNRALMYGYGNMAALWAGGLALGGIRVWQPVDVNFFLAVIALFVSACLMAWGWRWMWKM